jgi:anaerobic selenocysteine-containing dehydrogenase
MKKVKTVCPLDCPDSCGLIATVSDGKVISLQGDKEHPYTNGFTCRKIRRYPERLYSKHRILYPMLRTGPKGSGEFKRINWDKALDICADRLADIVKQHGGEAVLPYSYAGNMGAVNCFAGYPLFHKLGTSQLERTICSATAKAGWKKHCGNLPGCPPENCLHAKLIIAWGINVKTSNIHFWQYISKARKNGAKLVVIDPYRNQTAQSADYYVQVKPGGDTALALGILKSLIATDSLDNEFITQYSQGFKQFQSSLDQCDWDSLIQQSGLRKATIKELANLFNQHADKTFLRIGIGLSRNSRGGMSVRSITSLAAAMGLFRGGKGRGVLLSSAAFKGTQAALTHPELAKKTSRSVNMIHLGHALTALSPPVKALLVYNSNPLSVNPDAAMVRRGLAREDLFTIVHEQVMTPTAYYADLLLPATTFLENHDIYTAYGHFYLQVAKPVIEPVGEGRSNFDFFQQLAARMGLDDPPFRESCEERIRAYLTGMGGLPKNTDILKLLDGGYIQSSRSYPEGDAFMRQNHNYRFAVNDQPALPATPFLTSAREFNDPDLCSRFPFKLLTPPHPDLLNSTFGEFYTNRLGDVLIHPDDAAEYGVHEDEEILLVNFRGKTRRIARITTDTQQGVLVAEGIFWDANTSGNYSGEGGINDLTSQKLTDMGDGATFHESLVTIQRLRLPSFSTSFISFISRVERRILKKRASSRLD